jgi:DNA-directed RNA polymerase specialized sigma24 family protein
MSDSEFEAFYQTVFLPLVRRATWKYRLEKEDAADIVQDAFLLALGKLDAGGNPKAWLVQVVDHLALNLQRKSSRRTKLALRFGFSKSSEGCDEVEELSGAEEGVGH